MRANELARFRREGTAQPRNSGVCFNAALPDVIGQKVGPQPFEREALHYQIGWTLTEDSRALAIENIIVWSREPENIAHELDVRGRLIPEGNMRGDTENEQRQRHDGYWGKLEVAWSNEVRIATQPITERTAEPRS